VLDASDIPSNPALQRASFDKVFSNAALHWVLREPSIRQPFFHAVAAAVRTNGIFALEMGGLGNVCEMRVALLMAVARRVPGGIAAARAAEPWFFPDEKWITHALETAGFRVDRVEREWRPTRADKGGVEGWVRLFGSHVLESIKDEEQREAAAREAAEVLREVCKQPDGGEMISYVRLRALATKL
jgi:trans-aconitate methyltransferase